MKLTVKSANVVTETTQKGTVLHKQQVALDQGKDYPLVFAVTVANGQPYPAGEYDFDPSSFRINRFGGIEFDPYAIRLVLKGK